MVSPELISISKFESPAVQDFIRDREIKPEHFGVIKELLDIPKAFIIENFHNFFQSYNQASVGELQTYLLSEKSLEVKKVSSLLLQIVENYDWTVGFNMITVLERL